MSKKTTFWNPDKLLSIAAIILSLGTLVVFIFKTDIIIKHQYASALPYLEIGLENYGTNHIVLAVENTGVGPALIEDVKILYKGKVYKKKPVQFAIDQFPDRLDTLKHHLIYSAISPGKLIPSGGRIEIIEVNESYRASEEIYQIFNNENAQVEIKYKSIYDEKWSINSSHLSPIKFED